MQKKRVLWELCQVNTSVKYVIEAESIASIFAHLTSNGYTPSQPTGKLDSDWHYRVKGQLFMIARPLQTKKV